MCCGKGGVGGGLGSTCTRSQALLLGPAETPRNPETCGNYLGPDIYFLFYCLALHRRECRAGPQAVWIMSEAVRIRFLDESPDQTKEVGVGERCEERWEETDLLFQLSAPLRKAPLACEAGQGTS